MSAELVEWLPGCLDEDEGKREDPAGIRAMFEGSDRLVAASKETSMSRSPIEMDPPAITVVRGPP